VAPDPVCVGKQQSTEFFICSALMLVFGVGFHSYGAPVGLELALAAAVAGAGLFLLTGNEQARMVGIVVLGAVALVGGVSTFSGSYMPGTIVAVITLIRMLSTGGAGLGTRGLPPDPSGVAQPYYGQPAGYGATASPQPYGSYGAQPPAPPQPYGQSPAPQPYAGDPRFGAPTPAQAMPPAPMPPAPMPQAPIPPGRAPWTPMPPPPMPPAPPAG
jgi:hypothetical protein